MKNGLVFGALLLALLGLGGCVSGAPSGSSTGGARCLSRPDTSGTQPLFYIFCIQSS
jgi:hypothetical protein